MAVLARHPDTKVLIAFWLLGEWFRV